MVVQYVLESLFVGCAWGVFGPIVISLIKGEDSIPTMHLVTSGVAGGVVYLLVYSLFQCVMRGGWENHMAIVKCSQIARRKEGEDI